MHFKANPDVIEYPLAKPSCSARFPFAFILYSSTRGGFSSR